jgi:glycogen debranching enzyme
VELSWIFADKSTILIKVEALNVDAQVTAGIRIDCDEVKEITVDNTILVYSPRWVIAGVSKEGIADLTISGLKADFNSSGDSAVFVLNYGADQVTVNAHAAIASEYSFEEAFNKNIHFFDLLPDVSRVSTREQRIFSKCASVMKVNCLSPQGDTQLPWTTPDRWPHRDMWIWDSGFHSLGLRHISGDWAENSIKAVLSRQHEDGFIAHRMGVDDESTIIQPPILAWSAWTVYETTRNVEFVEYCYPKLVKMIEYDLRERDSDGNGLSEWNDGDSSGMDNSPRFDSPVKDAIDLNCFIANEMLYLSHMAALLGNHDESTIWMNSREKSANLINQHLWDDETGYYYDNDLNGNLVKIKTEAGFVPMFAGIASDEQVEKLVDHLTDPLQFWRAFPVSSVSADEPTFSDNMWRGPVWINFNYFIIEGLKHYGYSDLAKDLRRRTIDEIIRWYETDGVIYEFYDSEGEISPVYLHRKAQGGPDVRRMASLGTTVCDYNWTAALLMDMISMQ